MKIKKVIFSLLDTPAFGGAEQYIFSHLQFLNQQGYHIILATNNKKVREIILSRLTRAEQKTFEIIDCPYKLDAIGDWKGLVKYFLGLPAAAKWCYRTLKLLTKQYDKVICFWPGFSDRLSFSPIAYFLHCPLIWIEIGPLEPTFKHNWGFPHFLFDSAKKYPTHIITTSLFTKKSILRNSHFSEEVITLVYPGTKLFTQKEIKTYMQLGKKWQLKEKLNKKILIGLIARLAHENEVAMVIKAISIYLKSENHENILLLIIGDGPLRIELEKLVKKLHVSEHARFTGFVSEEEKRTLLAACTFFIFPRAWELDGFGMTTIEAMSFGLPVLTTDFGPQKEIVTDGKEGYRYKPHDSADLAKKMKKMINDGEKIRTNMIKQTLKRIKIFSEDISHQIMLNVIKKVSH